MYVGHSCTNNNDGLMENMNNNNKQTEDQTIGGRKEKQNVKVQRREKHHMTIYIYFLSVNTIKRLKLLPFFFIHFGNE